MGKEDRKRILDLAAACVLRDRNATHGEAEDNFATIAEYWTTHLHARGLLPKGVALSREDVAIMFAQTKHARLARSFDHEDNWVDGAGYMACGGGCAAEVKRSVAATPVAKWEICSPPVKPPFPGHPQDCVCDCCSWPEGVLTDGNGMPAVTAPLEQTLVRLDDLGPLEWFIRGTLPFGYQVGITPESAGPALYVTAPTGHKLDRITLRDCQGDTYLDIAKVVDRQIKSWEAPSGAAPAFQEGVLSPPPPAEPKAKCGIPCHRVCEECRLPCTCGGAHCAFCAPNAT